MSLYSCKIRIFCKKRSYSKNKPPNRYDHAVAIRLKVDCKFMYFNRRDGHHNFCIRTLTCWYYGQYISCHNIMSFQTMVVWMAREFKLWQSLNDYNCAVMIKIPYQPHTTFRQVNGKTVANSRKEVWGCYGIFLNVSVQGLA